MSGKTRKCKRSTTAQRWRAFSWLRMSATKTLAASGKPKPEWHTLVAWRKLAEVVAERVQKGSFLFVEGKLTHRTYTDNEGITRKSSQIVINTLRVLDKREGASYRPENAPMPTVDDEPPAGDDDLPF